MSIICANTESFEHATELVQCQNTIAVAIELAEDFPQNEFFVVTSGSSVLNFQSESGDKCLDIFRVDFEMRSLG